VAALEEVVISQHLLEEERQLTEKRSEESVIGRIAAKFENRSADEQPPPRADPGLTGDAPGRGGPDMPDPRPQRSLIRWSVIALGVVVVFAIIYFLTHGFGAPASIAP
jgi:hypothetical protein